MAAPTKFTEKAQEAVVEAQRETERRKLSQFEPEVLLAALVNQQDGIVPQVLHKLEVDPRVIASETESEIEKLPVLQYSSEASVSQGMRRVLEVAEKEAKQFGDEYISTEHLLLGIALGSSPASKLLARHGVNVNSIREALKSVRGSQRVTDANPEGKYQALEKYGRDLTQLAHNGKLDPVIGRDEEIRRVIQVLSRRTKNNPVLIGEPGVGKTAIAEGLAQRIVRGDVPEGLKDKKIIALDMGSLIAGASYKGEIEDRLKSILAEIKMFDKAILFIDEIHSLIDKHGSAGGAVNMLKPELARGEITLIGATTMDEYRKYIEKDEALNRRFEQLLVEEPDAMACFHMMKKVIPNFEKHHSLQVADDTIKETIRLAKRYIKDRRLPDAAIDLADRSMAALRMINDTGGKDLEDFRKNYEAWDKDDQQGNKHSAEEWQWLHIQMRSRLSPALRSGATVISPPRTGSSFRQAGAVKPASNTMQNTAKDQVLRSMASCPIVSPPSSPG